MKYTLLLSFLILTFSFSFAQKARFGLSPGISLSWIKINPDDNLDQGSYPGFDGGGLFEIGNPSFKFQTEVNFSMKGVEYDQIKQAVKFQYLTVPFLLKFRNPKTPLWFYAGPQVGFILSAKNLNRTTGTSLDVEARYRSTDMGLVAGAEFKFTDNIFITARYYNGFQKITPKESPIEMKHRSATLRLGFLF